MQPDIPTRTRKRFFGAHWQIDRDPVASEKNPDGVWRYRMSDDKDAQTRTLWLSATENRAAMVAILQAMGIGIVNRHTGETGKIAITISAADYTDVIKPLVDAFIRIYGPPESRLEAPVVIIWHPPAGTQPAIRKPPTVILSAPTA